MVGRDAVLAALQQRLGEVRAGSGRAVFVLAEAGLGKSRLIAEFQRSTAAIPRLTWATGSALSYGQTLPYHQLIDLARSLVGAPSAAEEPQVRAALDAAVEQVLADATADERAETRMLLGHLLSVELSPEDRRRADGLEAKTLAAGYLKALRRLLAALGAQGPMVLVLEDIHWADSASVDALVNLLPLVEELPILLLAAGRPDHTAIGLRLLIAARSRLGTAVTEIPLEPLSDAESRQLVANLLMIESLPVTVREFILARAEGNPFFVEEVIRMLIDRGAIVQQGGHWWATAAIEGVEIPDTLQGLLLARIDRLPEDAKRTLRVASVIGRQFSARVLEEVLQSSSAS
jgi:predicted ATPase